MSPEMSPNDGFLGDEDFTGALKKLRKRINKKSKHLFTPGTPSVLRSRRIREEPVDVLALLVKIFLTVILVSTILYDPVFIGDTQKGGNMTLKYESFKFGVERHSSVGLKIKDQETGEPLGGKRAAIQYYFSVVNCSAPGCGDIY